jgi:DNA-binding beta-propeller fold protein YncE
MASHRLGNRRFRGALKLVQLLKPASVVGVACALVVLSSPAVATAASPLPARALSAHHHFPVPWAPGGAPGYHWPGPFGSGAGSLGTATLTSVPVGAEPSELGLNSATHTLYVANGYNDNGPYVNGDTVSVIDTRRCNALDISRCKGPWPTITVGNAPSTIAIDQATDTVYVTDTGDNTVSVFNGATCDAIDSSGCSQHPATVPVGLGPIGILADPANDTVYVANYENGGPSTTLSMIDSSTCNANDLAGCPSTEPPTVDVGGSPNYIDLDQATHTVYVTTIGARNGWSVFDADNCNAVVQSGCASLGHLTGDSSGPNAALVDSANDTLYTANYDDTVSAFDLANCNASDLTGCASTPSGTVSAFPPSSGPNTLFLAVDIPLHTVYVTYQGNDSLAAIDTNVCNGANLGGCASLHPPLARTGTDPQGVVLDPQTQTLYVANEVDNDVSVINAASCNAAITSGCRKDPTAVPVGWPDIFTPEGLAADPAVRTVYDITGGVVAMVNTRTCNSHAQAGCSATAPQFAVGSYPDAIALDPLAHTVYVANFGSVSSAGPSSVSVVNADACNATDQVGCTVPETLTVPGGNADTLAVDVATGTLYVGTETVAGPDLVSVFNASTCNAIVTAGCGQVPSTIQVGNSGGLFSNSEPVVAINQVTNTIYAIDTYNLAPGGTPTSPGLYVMNGATCDAAHVAGCNQSPMLMPLGLSSTTATGPGTLPAWGLTVDPATDTVYAALSADGDYAATVAVVNGATCNGSVTTGCDQVAPQVPAGFNALGIALDPFTHDVYTANLADASVSVVHGAICNGVVSSGCGRAATKLPAAHWPASIVADPAVGTLYVAGLSALSVLPLVP